MLWHSREPGEVPIYQSPLKPLFLLSVNRPQGLPSSVEPKRVDWYFKDTIAVDIKWELVGLINAGIFPIHFLDIYFTANRVSTF